MKLKYVIIVGLVLLVAIIYFHSISSSGFMPSASGGKYLLPLLVASALVDSTNPCAFSILLLTIAFLFSIGRLRSDILKAGGLYVFGIFLVYILIGLGILQTLDVFNVPHFMAKIGATILILFGLISITNHFFPKFPIRLGIPQSAHERLAELMVKASLPTSFGLGVLVGLFEFPCAGGPYLSVLGLLHDKGSFWAGFGYLILFNVIFVLPLTVMLLIASNKTLLEKAQAWRKSETGKARLWGGLAMVVIGLIIFTL
jgi:cytochrome c biogenesis protein CcdA